MISSFLGRRLGVGLAVDRENASFRTIHGEVFDPFVVACVEALGYQAGRYVPGLSAWIDVRSRLNTLLEVRLNLERLLKCDLPVTSQDGTVLEGPWTTALGGSPATADRVDYANRLRCKLAELDLQISGLRAWRSRLDNTCTIDHRPCFLSDFRRYQREWPIKRVFSEFMFARREADPDVWSQFLRDMARNGRQNEYLSRLDVELARAVRDGWFVVFDSLTIDPSKEDAFFADPQAIRDHVRSLGRRVAAACGQKVALGFDNVFRYLGVPEFGRKNGRLHFHLIYLCKRLPRGSFDPNIGRRVRNRREVESFRCWPYGFQSPKACRFADDAFTRAGWLWPVDSTLRPLACKPPIAVARYVAKYIGKSFKERDEWQASNQSRKSQFRLRMTRGFGQMPDLSKLSLSVLLELSCLHFSVTKSARLLRRGALRTMSLRLAGLSIADYLGLMNPQRGLLERLRDLTASFPSLSQRSSIAELIPKLRATDISDECAAFIASVPCLSKDRVPISAK